MSPRRVVVHAAGLAFDPHRAVTAEFLCASVGRLLDRAVPEAPDRARLVALPEHTGLLAMLVGDRGEQARALLGAGASATAVLEALAAGYADRIGAAMARFPTVASPMVLLHLAVADTVLRVVVDGFGTLAADRSLWLSVGAAVPDWDRSDDPDAADRFVVRAPQVRNRNLLLTPDGRLAAVQDKAYLVDAEHAADGLGLTPAGLEEVAVAVLAIGRVASVISKDAWMPDVNDRLDQLGAQVLLQPEAFDRWGRVDREAVDDGTGRADLWPPDKFQRGGWWMLRRHRAPVVNVAPMLLGGIGEQHFDGQAVVTTADPGSPRRGLLGQPVDVGWAAVGPWWVVDEPAERLADPGRRAAFEQADLARADAPVTIEHDHLVHAEVSLRSASVPMPLPPSGAGVSTAVDGRSGGMQLVPDLAAELGGARLVWIDVAGAADQGVLSARYDVHGWSDPVALDAPAARSVDGSGRRWRPRIAAATTGSVCLYLGFPEGSWDLLAVPIIDAGPSSGPVRVDDADTGRGLVRERGHDAPALVCDGGELVAVWSDLRWPWVFPQVRLARSGDGGRTWTASRRVDGATIVGQVDPLAPRSEHETRGQTAPAVVAVPDGLMVAWQELGPDGRPAIWGVRLRDGVATTEPLRLDAGDAAAYRPALAVRDATVWLAYEREPGDAGGGSVVLRRSDDAGVTFSSPREVDPSCPAGAAQGRAVIVAPAVGARGGPTVVVQDDRAGETRLLAVAVDDLGSLAPPVRIDDAPVGAAARVPTAVRCDAGVLVVWQDTRGGREHLRSVLLADR